MAIGDALPAARQVARRAPEPQRSKLPAPSPFAEDVSGADYFRTDQHYRFIARAITRHLQEMRGFVLVTGEPPADGKAVELLLCDEKQKAILLTCLPDMTFADLVCAYGREVGLPIADGVKGVWSLMSHLMGEARRGVTHLLVLDKPDLLDAATLDEFFGLLKLDEPYLTPVVLLASPSFPARFEAPPLDAHAPLLVARLALQHLEREEVFDFIDRQLAGASDAEARLFTSEIIETIAQAANGSPLVANRLARTVLISAAGSEAEVAIPAVPDDIAPPPPSDVTIPPFDRGDPLPSFLVPDRHAGNVQDDASPPSRSPSSGAKRRARPIGRRARQVAGFAAVLMAITAIPLTPVERAVDFALAPRQDVPLPAAVFAPLPPAETGAASAYAPIENSWNETPPAEDPPPVPPPLDAVTPAASLPSQVSVSAAEPPTSPADEPPAVRRGDNPSSPAPTIAASSLAPEHIARPPEEITMMVRRGQELLTGGDILSARHFFELAAPEAEDRAALGLGKSYDPLYLRRLGTRGPAGDAGKAAMWYRKAADLGNMEALALLQRLNASAAQ